MKTAVKLLKTVHYIISYVIIAAAAVLGALFLAGIRPYAVKTGSMEPAIHEGAVCFVNSRAEYASIREGDIIAFRMGEMMVTHRAIRVDEDGIITKGDANNTEDAAKVTEENFVGRIIFNVPWLGKVILFLQTKRGKIICIDAILFFAAYLFFRNRLEKSRSESENENGTQTSSDMDETLM